MIRRLGLTFGIVIAMVGGSTQAASTAPPQLILRPSAAHPGDMLHLSGRGFGPMSRLSIQIACPAQDPRFPHPAVLVAGPRVNAKGTFAGFSVRTPAGGSGHCTVYASQGAGGVLAHATYRVVPTDMALPPCSVHMCMHVKGVLVRLRNKTQGTVVVTGWPGARARIVVSGPTIRTKTRWVRLNWRGVSSVRLRVALGLQKSLTAHAAVRAWLGSTRGHRTAIFVAIPGGR
jgi:hypothetical protein